MRTAADIMTRDLRVLNEEDPLTEVGLNMDIFGLRHLPVVDGDKLIGLVTHRDLLRWSTSQLEPGATARDAELKDSHFVASVMTRDVATCAPTDSLAEVARLLVKTKFGCLPVVDKGKLVGIITEHDLLKVLVGVIELDEERSVKAIRGLHLGRRP